MGRLGILLCPSEGRFRFGLPFQALGCESQPATHLRDKLQLGGMDTGSGQLMIVLPSELVHGKVLHMTGMIFKKGL